MPVATAEGHDCCFTLETVLAVRALHVPLEPQARWRAAEEAIARHLNPAVAFPATGGAFAGSAGASDVRDRVVQ